jgi:hypothetical protein
MRRTYAPAFDIWTVPGYLRGLIQPGQWVTAGPNGPRGRYMGQKPGGSDVVAWQNNARGRKGYGAALRAYARA